MQVLNVHERELACAPEVAGGLLDRLASADDPIWPTRHWPPMRFAGRSEALATGLRGGHGPVRYTIEAYDAGRSIVFRFGAPRGFDGIHRLEVVDVPQLEGSPRCMLRHEIVMRTHGLGLFSWPLLIRPLHDALLEDALDNAERAAGCEPAEAARWSPYVRSLRAAFALARRITSRHSEGARSGATHSNVA